MGKTKTWEKSAMKRLLLLLSVAFALAGFSSMANAECGKVTIGEMDWSSARIIANVEKFILQEGYGCEVDLMPTSTLPAMTSNLEKGEADIASEIWVNSVKESYEKGINEGWIVKAGNVLSDGGVEAWWIPDYLVEEHPEITTIDGLKKNWKLFEDSKNPGKGRFYGCKAGWACQVINNNLFKAYGLGETFVRFDPGSAEELDGSIAKAYERKVPWVGYYWGPTAMLGKYPLVQVQLEPFDPKAHKCNQKTDCDNPGVGRYPPSDVLAVTTKKFKETHPGEFKFISQIGFPNNVMNTVLAWGVDSQAGGPEMARYFMENYKDLWKSWLPEDVANKVEAAL